MRKVISIVMLVGGCVCVSAMTFSGSTSYPILSMGYASESKEPIEIPSGNDCGIVYDDVYEYRRMAEIFGGTSKRCN